MKKVLLLVVTILLCASMLIATTAYAYTGDLTTTKDDLDPNGTYIYFDAAGIGWDSAKMVFCHIWDAEGNVLTNYQGKSSKLVKWYDDCYAYNLDNLKTELKDDEIYYIYFYETGAQLKGATPSSTYNQFPNGALTFTTECIDGVVHCTCYNYDPDYQYPTDENGDMLPVPSEDIENWRATEDTLDEAYIFVEWNNREDSNHGMTKSINRYGKIHGRLLVNGKTDYDLLLDFCKNTIGEARKYSKKSDQELLDYLGTELKLSKDDVENAIFYSLNNIAWKKDLSTIPDNNYNFTLKLIGSRRVDRGTTEKYVILEKPLEIQSDGTYFCTDDIILTGDILGGGLECALYLDGEQFGSMSGSGGIYPSDYREVGRVEGYVKIKEGYPIDSYAYADLDHIEMGDVNMDGNTNIVDATTIQQRLAKLITDDNICVLAGTMTGDSMSIVDATHIQQWLAHLIDVL